MECGKLKTAGRGGAASVFYFIVDPAAPDAPSPASIRTYYVVTHVDSYIEAFQFLARRLASGVADTGRLLSHWHTLYTRVFGHVSTESFRTSLDSLPVDHYFLETTEAAARARAQTAHRVPEGGAARIPMLIENRAVGGGEAAYRHGSPGPDVRRTSAGVGLAGAARPAAFPATSVRHEAGAGGGNSPVRRAFAEHAAATAGGAGGSHFASSEPLFRSNPAASGYTGAEGPTGFRSPITNPTQQDPPEARVEAQRLKAELTEVAGALDLERGRQRVDALGDAERQQLQLQLGQARQDADEQREKARVASETMRAAVKALEDRIATVEEQCARAVDEAQAGATARVEELEQAMGRRDAQLRAECDEAVAARDRHLAKAVSRVQAFESQLTAALQRIEEQKAELAAAQTAAQDADRRRAQLEEENRQLRQRGRELEGLVEQSRSAAHEAQQAGQRARAEADAAGRQVVHLQQQRDKYLFLGEALHREIGVIDENAVSAAETLRRKVMMARDGGGSFHVALPGAVSSGFSGYGPGMR